MPQLFVICLVLPILLLFVPPSNDGIGCVKGLITIGLLVGLVGTIVQLV